VERFQDSARVKAWRPADEFDHLLKLSGAKLRYNLFDAALVEQQDSRDHTLGHAFSGGPAQPMRKKIEAGRLFPAWPRVFWTARQTTTSMSTIGGGDIIVQPEKPAAKHSA
jgi:hypothetical protein